MAEPHRLRVRGGLAACVLVAVFVAASARLLVFPRRDHPGQADAIVVLGGGGHRRPLGYDLARRGLAPTLLVSTSDPTKVLHGLPALDGVDVVRFRPAPFSTQGEARYLAAQARVKGWKRVVVVAGRSQVTRTRLRVTRCFDGEVEVVAAPLQLRWLPYDVAYEWAALAKAVVFQRGC